MQGQKFWPWHLRSGSGKESLGVCGQLGPGSRGAVSRGTWPAVNSGPFVVRDADARPSWKSE